MEEESTEPVDLSFKLKSRLTEAESVGIKCEPSWSLLENKEGHGERQLEEEEGRRSHGELSDEAVISSTSEQKPQIAADKQNGVNNHSNIRHICPECGVTFRQRSTLDAHMLYYCNQRANRPAAALDVLRPATTSPPLAPSSSTNATALMEAAKRLVAKRSIEEVLAQSQVLAAQLAAASTVLPLTTALHHVVSNHQPHRVVHKPHGCAACGVRFTAEANLAIHRENYCSARNVQDTAEALPLAKRVRTSQEPSPEDPSSKPFAKFECQYCGIKFNQQANLRAHQLYYCEETVNEAEKKKLSVSVLVNKSEPETSHDDSEDGANNWNSTLSTQHPLQDSEKGNVEAREISSPPRPRTLSPRMGMSVTSPSSPPLSDDRASWTPTPSVGEQQQSIPLRDSVLCMLCSNLFASESQCLRHLTEFHKLSSAAQQHSVLRHIMKRGMGLLEHSCPSIHMQSTLHFDKMTQTNEEMR